MNKKIILPIFILCLAIFTVIPINFKAYATPNNNVTYTASHAGWVNEYYPTTNFGDFYASESEAGRNAPYNRELYSNFDLTALQTLYNNGAIISSAIFSVRCTSLTSSTIGIYNVTSAWNPLTMTWNSGRPTMDTIKVIVSPATPNANVWNNYTVTNHINYILAKNSPSTFYGLGLDGAGASISSFKTYSPFKPVLYVVYYYPNTITFYYNSGGFLMVDGNKINNGSVSYFGSCVYRLVGASNSVSNIWKSFNYTGYSSGSSTTQNYNFTASGGDYTVWCYFGSAGIPTPYTTARFNYTRVNPYNGTTVYFNASYSVSSGSITNYSWLFGDGGSNSGSSVPNHIYNNAGNFTVTLTVTSSVGSNIFCEEITVIVNQYSIGYSDGYSDGYIAGHTSYIIARFNFNCSNPYINSTIQFNGTSSVSSANITSYYWEFGDNQTSISSIPTHSYIAVGNYTIFLNVTSLVGSNITSQVITVTNIPIIPLSNEVFLLIIFSIALISGVVSFIFAKKVF